MDKAAVRCTECDREVEHYNTFVAPTNETSVVCWECLQRQEKGFNAKRDFRRDHAGALSPDRWRSARYPNTPKKYSPR
jgi:hypothetical protein